MLALHDAVRAGKIPNAEIVVVISDKADAAGLALARERALETLAIERKGRKREEHELEIIEALRERRVDLICLAGYMCLLSPCFIDAFPRRILDRKSTRLNSSHSQISYAVFCLKKKKKQRKKKKYKQRI